jgi:ParB family chromosome partitioning protein
MGLNSSAGLELQASAESGVEKAPATNESGQAARSPMAGLERAVVKNEAVAAAQANLARTLGSATPSATGAHGVALNPASGNSAAPMGTSLRGPAGSAPAQNVSSSTPEASAHAAQAPETSAHGSQTPDANTGASSGPIELQGVIEDEAGDGGSAAADGVEIHAAARRSSDLEVIEIPLARIDKNPYQTRYFTLADELELVALAQSIKAQGVIQPITVRPGAKGRYILIAGERRTEASRLAEKTTIPAIVREVSDQQAAEMTIIENLLREDLNCMDQTRAFVLLSTKFQLTQAEIAQRVGVSRETVANYMRLARLPKEAQDHLTHGRLDYAHARLLLKIEDETVLMRVIRKVVEEKLRPDELEDLLYASNPTILKPVEERQSRGARWVDPNVRAAQREIERVLGMRVRIRDRHNKGKITIEYGNLEDFDRVVKALRGK